MNIKIKKIPDHSNHRVAISGLKNWIIMYIS